MVERLTFGCGLLLRLLDTLLPGILGFCVYLVLFVVLRVWCFVCLLFLACDAVVWAKVVVFGLAFSLVCAVRLLVR